MVNGIEDMLVREPQISLYPNPATDRLVIAHDMSYTKEAVIELYDVVGKRVQTWQIAQPGTADITLDVSGLSKGMYLMRVQADQGKTVTRFVKE